MSEKLSSPHKEESVGTTVLESVGGNDSDLDRITTMDVDNYHGLTIKTVLVFLALCLQYFVQIFLLVGAGALPRYIAASIGGADKTIWLSQAIAIITVVGGPPVSQATDYFGRKWFLVFAAASGSVGALITARADNMDQVIAGSVISGILFIGQPVLFAVSSEILPRKWRSVAQGGINIGGGSGGLIGLLVGAKLASDSLFGWRNYWYICTAILGFASLTIVFLYNPPQRPLQKSLTLKEKLARLDWVAYILLAVGLVLFIIGLSWGNNPFPWTNVHVLSTLIIGGVVLVALIVHQTFIKKDGLVHHDLFKTDRNFAICLFCFLVDGMVFFAANSYFAFEVSVLFETDAILVNLHFCIAFFGALVSSGSIAIVSYFTKTVREPIVFSFVCFTVFYVGMAVADLSSGTAMWCYPILLGWGLGWSLTYLVAVAQLSTPPHLIAVTSGILISMRSVGSSVSLGIYTAIFNSQISKLGANIAAAVLPLGLAPTSLEGFIGALANNQQEALAKVPGVTPQIIGAGVGALQSTYLSSFRHVWIAASVFSGIASLASCFLINPKTQNNHVDAPLDED